MSKNAIKRIMQKDMKAIEEQNLGELGIYITFNEENIREAKAMIIGPEGGLYEDGFLFFNIKFPNNYPYAPPDVSYVPINRVRIHPNIYAGGHVNGGKVCLSILGTWSGPKWTSIMDISTVLLCIQSLLDNNPLHHEPGQEQNMGNTNTIYNQIIGYNTIQSLITDNLKRIPIGFEDFKESLEQHFELKKDSIIKRIENWDKKESIVCRISFYKINHILNYKKAYDELLKQ
jgi:ubiquitin-protein ligase